MIRRTDLGRRERIADGAAGVVYRVPDFSLPGHGPLAFKEVKPGCEATTGPMARSVAFRASLSAADQADLDAFTTWPIEMVEDAGRPCGLIMPLLTPDFFVRAHPPGGPPEDLVLDLQWLSAADATARSAGVDRSALQDVLVRLALLAKLVYAVGRLHKLGAVYGDISLRNAAVAVGPPRVRLMDCDGAAAAADHTRVQFHTPSFMPPEIPPGARTLQDSCTDVYKLGLCVVRGLQYGRGITQATDPAPLAGVLDAAALDAVTRAVGADRARRPSAKELFAALAGCLRGKVSPPTLSRVSLSRATMLRGEQVEVVWEAEGGRTVHIAGANGFAVTLPDPGSPVGRHVITPAASGEIVVGIANGNGATRAVAGSVTLYDLPPVRVELGAVPRPAVPAMPRIAVADVLGPIPAVPAIALPAHGVPRIAAPPLEPVAALLRDRRSPATPVGELGAAVAAASGRLRSSLLTAADVASAHARARADSAQLESAQPRHDGERHPRE